MNDLTVNPFVTLPPTGSTTDRSASSEGLSSSNAGFQQMLSALLMSSTLPTSESDSPLGGDLLSPVFFTLIEQMLTQQMNNLQASSAATSSQATGAVASGNLPVQGYLTQNYHTGHNGIDLGVKVGTPVHTSMEGKVVYAGWNNQGYGNLVVVENGAYQTYYAHLSQIPVALGQTVHKGEVIGLSGNTGNSTGPHLHYEVRVNGTPVNPAGSSFAQRS